MDPFLAKIDAVERSVDALADALHRCPEFFQMARAEWEAGGAMSQVAQRVAATGAERRIAVARAYRDYEHAALELRAAVVRAQVDEGLTLSQLARAMGVTRQTVARLYQVGSRE